MTTASANRKTAVQAKTISEAGGISAPSVRSAQKDNDQHRHERQRKPDVRHNDRGAHQPARLRIFLRKASRKKARVPARKIKKELFPERKHRRHEVAQIDAFFRRPAPETGLAAQFHDHVPYKTARQADSCQHELHIDGENAALLVPGICRKKPQTVSAANATRRNTTASVAHRGGFTCRFASSKTLNGSAVFGERYAGNSEKAKPQPAQNRSPSARSLPQRGQYSIFSPPFSSSFIPRMYLRCFFILRKGTARIV